MYSIQHYVINFVSDLRQVSGFLRVLRFPLPKKTDRYDITEILLKVVLDTITLTPRIFEILNVWRLFRTLQEIFITWTFTF